MGVCVCLLLESFLTSVLADGLSLEFELEQVSSSLQDFSLLLSLFSLLFL